jgi:hypothetical protein
MIDYGFSNTTFEPPNHAFTHALKVDEGLEVSNIARIVVESIINNRII